MAAYTIMVTFKFSVPNVSLGLHSYTGPATHMIRVGLARTIYIYGVYTVFLAGSLPNIRSYTVYLYGSGHPYDTCI